MSTPSIGYWCSIAAHQYFDRLLGRLDHLGIDRWFYVLLTIDETAEALSQQQLADALHLDKVTMVRALDHLSERGFVERCACKDDRRKYLVKLTGKSRSALKEIRKAYDKVNDQAFEGFSKSERRMFVQRLDTVVANLASKNGPVRVNNKKIRS